MKTSSNSFSVSRTAQVCLRIGQAFGVILLLCALVPLKNLVGYMIDVSNAKAWKPIEAKILEVELDSEKVELDDQPILRVKYQYQIDGQTHTGTRHDFADSPYYLKPLFQETVDELTRAMDSQKRVECFVDPSEPSDSVLDRHFWIGVLGYRGGVFLVLSILGSLAIALAGGRIHHLKRIDEQRTAFPHEPWRWRPDWESGKLRSLRRGSSGVLIAVSAIFLLVVLPIGVDFLLASGGKILSFPGIALLVLAWGAINCIRVQLHYHRGYDASEFQMADATGTIGGPLAGIVRIPKKLPPETVLRLTLECIEINYSNGDESHEERVRWRDSKLLNKTLNTSESNVTHVPVHFAIPFDCTQSQPDRGSPVILWRLKVGPDGREGTQRYAVFDVPVFRTSESSAKFEADPELTGEFELPLDLETVRREAGCKLESLPNAGQSLTFTFFRTFASVGGVIIVALVLIGVGLIIRFTNPLWALIPAVFGGIVAFAMSDMLLWKSRIEIRSEGITVTSGWPFVGKPVVLLRDLPEQDEGVEDAAPEAIECFFADVEFAMREQTWYCLWLKTTDGRQLLIAKRLPSKKHAELLGQWVTEQIHVDPLATPRSTLRSAV